MTDWNKRYKSIVKVDGVEKFTSDLFIKAGSAWGEAMDFVEYWGLGGRSHLLSGKPIAILKDQVEVTVIDTITGKEVDPFAKPKKSFDPNAIVSPAKFDDGAIVLDSIASDAFTREPKKRHLKQVLTMCAGDDSVTVELDLDSRIYTAKIEVSCYTPAQIHTENAMEALNWAIDRIDYYMTDGKGNIPRAFTS